MNWFKNLKTGAKLLLGFGTMIVLLGMVMTIAYTAITTIRDSQQRLFEQEFVGVVDMVELRADLNRQRAQMLQMMLTTDRSKQESLVQNIHSRVKEIDHSLQELAAVYKNNGKFLLKLDELKTTLAAFRQTREGVFQQILAGKGEEAQRAVEGREVAPLREERPQRDRGDARHLREGVLERERDLVERHAGPCEPHEVLQDHLVLRRQPDLRERLRRPHRASPETTPSPIPYHP